VEEGLLLRSRRYIDSSGVIGGRQQLSLRPAGALPRLKECNMDTQTLLIIIIIVLLIGGGGWYGRGRWY
jgi:hypothetical protein